MIRRPRPQTPGPVDIAAMIRVDHAGEAGAVDIYRGQLMVMRARGSQAVNSVAEMELQEQGHLAAFETLVRERHVRKTVWRPLWHVAGFGMGAATAALGDEAAMACTEAVEEVIDVHYAAQIAALDGVDNALAVKLEQFRTDEIAHRDIARDAGAQSAPGYSLLSAVVKAGCRLAIALSTRG